MWRRIIFYISDLDAMFAWAIAQSLYSEAARVMPNGASDTFSCSTFDNEQRRAISKLSSDTMDILIPLPRNVKMADIKITA